MSPLAKLFIIVGVVFILMGGGIFLFQRLGVNIGRLPGDITIQRGNATCMIALGTSIFLSILLTLLLNLVVRLLNR